MLLQLNRPVMLVIWTLYCCLSCIITTAEVYGIYKPEVLLLLVLDFLPASSLSLRSLLRSITQVLSSSVTMPTSSKTLFAAAAAALSDT